MQLKLLYENEGVIIGYHRLPSYWMIVKIEEEGYKSITDRLCFERSLKVSREWKEMGDYFLVFEVDRSGFGTKDYVGDTECAIYNSSIVKFTHWGIDLGDKVIQFPFGTASDFDHKKYDQIVEKSGDKYLKYHWREDFYSGKEPEEIIDTYLEQRREWYN